MWNRGPIGGPFALIDHTGKLRTDEDFRGKLLLIYFGYRYCPDVCPTDLQQIGLAVDGLDAAAEAVQPIFITLDPERDTAAHPRRLRAGLPPAADRPNRQRGADSARGARLQSLLRQTPA